MALAVALQGMDQRERAAQLVEKALRSQKSPKEADYLGLVRAWMYVGRDDDARRVLHQKLLRHWPDSAQGAYMEGLLHMRRDGGLEHAIRSFERSLKRDSKLLDARYNYAVSLSRLGRSADAEREFRALLAAAPQFAGAHHGLADALRQQGKTSEAKNVLESFRLLDTASRQIDYLEMQRNLKKATAADLLQLGELYLALNQPTRAEQPLNEYVLQQPTDSKGFQKLAELYRLRNEPTKAQAMSKLAAALEPSMATR
jgi:predicted Zn-dependent protease